MKRNLCYFSVEVESYDLAFSDKRFNEILKKSFVFGSRNFYIACWYLSNISFVHRFSVVDCSTHEYVLRGV